MLAWNSQEGLALEEVSLECNCPIILCGIPGLDGSERAGRGMEAILTGMAFGNLTYFSMSAHAPNDT